jgi:hypothetical protein
MPDPIITPVRFCDSTSSGFQPESSTANCAATYAKLNKTILTALFARFNEIIHIQAASRIRARHLSGYLAGDIINFEIGDAGNPAFSCQDL